MDMLWDSQISRAEDQKWTRSRVAKSLSLTAVTSFGLAKAVCSPSSAWPRTAGAGARDWRALRCLPTVVPHRCPVPRAGRGRELARLSRRCAEWRAPSRGTRPQCPLLPGRQRGARPGCPTAPHLSLTPVLASTHPPPWPAAPAGAGASRRPPGLRRWQGLQAPRPSAPSPSPLPPAPGPSSRHWFGAGAPGARGPLPAPAPAAAAAPELSVRRQRRGPAPHRAPHRAQSPPPRSRRRGAQQVPCRGSRRRWGRAAPAGPGFEMGSPARTGAMGAGPRAGLAPAAPEGWPAVRSGGTVGALAAAAAAVLQKGGCARGTLRGPSPWPSGRRAGRGRPPGRAALRPFPPSGWTIAGNARVTFPHTYHSQC